MPGRDNVTAPFKFTMPITRAASEGGELFIEGEASGPEIDSYGTRIDPTVIHSFNTQIHERAEMGEPIVYRDTHGQGVTGDQPVMADFGELVAASVTDDNHLRVRVRLDQQNPAALFLHTQIQRGKQYGMSIGGDVLSYTDDFDKEVGSIVRTFTGVRLDHIANTSQPSWTPSLGTVLMRAVNRALQGENMDETVPAPETPAAEGAEEAAAPEEATVVETAAAEEAEHEHSDECDHETEAEAPAEAPAEEASAEEPAAAEAHMIQATALQPVADAVAALASAVTQLMATPNPVPVAVTRSDEGDAARSASESPVAENDDLAVLRAAVESLRTELASANDRIRQLEAEPAGDEPGVIQRAAEPNLQEELAKLDPHTRLVLGLQAAAEAANK